MFRWLRNRKAASVPYTPPEPPDTRSLAQAILQADSEAAGPDGFPEPGKSIHVFVYDELTLRVDRDILRMMRITAFLDEERRYSFSVRCPMSDLAHALDDMFAFLASDRHVRHLPDSQRLKGHYFTASQNPI
ncbi:MAG: hypothetical protein RIE53_05630 [Rhodothermales bacterium]